MKNYISIIVLIFSTSIFAQSGIENDELYLKYEQEYLKSIRSSTAASDYELANKNFYTIFNNYKDRAKFEKAKDKISWLSKNSNKLNSNSAAEALSLYKTFVESKQVLDNNSKFVEGIRNELIKKYDEKIIWETLQNRIKARK